MAYDNERLSHIFDRSGGECHLCERSLAFRNYGRFGARGAWEVDHSVPRAAGGTDHGNNLRAACITCNRAKGAGSTRAAQAAFGHTREPLSAKAREDAKLRNGLALGGLALLFAPAVGAGVAVALAFLAFIAGHDADPDLR